MYIQFFVQPLQKWTKPILALPAVDLSSEVFRTTFKSVDEKIETRSHRRRLKKLVIEVFENAIRKKLVIGLTTVPEIEVLGGPKRRIRPEILSKDQARTLIELATIEEHRWRDRWAFLYLSLMRSQELYALRWSKVDRVARKILVDESFSIKEKRRLKREAEKAKIPLDPNAGFKCDKTDYWRHVPINADLDRILDKQWELTGHTEFVFERDPWWETNKQAAILRKFCLRHNIPSICVHTLRACGATHLLEQGVEQPKVMKLGGWRSLESFAHYIRLAGIEVKGLTDKHFILPIKGFADNVVPLRASQDVR